MIKFNDSKNLSTFVHSTHINVSNRKNIIQTSSALNVINFYFSTIYIHTSDLFRPFRTNFGLVLVNITNSGRDDNVKIYIFIYI